MKNLTLAFFAAAFLFSCQSENTSQNKIVDNELKAENIDTNQIESIEPTTTSGLEGMYVGFFTAKTYDYKKKPSYSNKINLVITSVQDGIIKGHSVVAGSKRPFEGTIDADYNVVASEPGDDKYDGVFTFQYSSQTQKVSGTWKANDSKLAVTERSYQLEKKIFTYDPNILIAELGSAEDEEYPFGHLIENQDDSEIELERVTWDAVKINASNKLLKKEDIENLYKSDLEIIRNSMYARHGYSFRNRKMRYFFDSYVDWYIPTSIDITNDLTEIEKKNEELIKRYEEHAEAYYDYFGR